MLALITCSCCTGLVFSLHNRVGQKDLTDSVDSLLTVCSFCYEACFYQCYKACLSRLRGNDDAHCFVAQASDSVMSRYTSDDQWASTGAFGFFGSQGSQGSDCCSSLCGS